MCGLIRAQHGRLIIIIHGLCVQCIGLLVGMLMGRDCRVSSAQEVFRRFPWRRFPWRCLLRLHLSDFWPQVGAVCPAERVGGFLNCGCQIDRQGRNWIQYQVTQVHSLAHSITHSLTRSHSINQSIAYSLTHTFTNSLTRSFSNSLIHSLNRSINQSINQPKIQSTNQSYWSLT